MSGSRREAKKAARSEYRDYTSGHRSSSVQGDASGHMDKRAPKASLVCRIIMYILMAAQLVVSCFLLGRLFKMGVVPTKYMIIAIVLLLIFDLLTYPAGKKIWSSIVMSVLAIVMIVVMYYGYTVLTKVDKTIENITVGADEQTVEMVIVVLADDETAQISDLSEYIIGYFADADVEATESVESEINDAVGGLPTYTGFDDITLMADSLYNKTSDALIMNKAYMGVLEGMDGYTDFESKVKIIYSSEITTRIEIVSEHETSLDTFVVYISGIDQYGSVNTIRNSDVNILMVVNTKTKHIQLINTPRDYYVDIPISTEWKDKLTHCGVYGIECSIGALENLYDTDIDFYVKMNFTGFVDIIDSLGGVDVNSEYEFTASGLSFTKGVNHLTGSEALVFARERHAFASGDRQRGKNQMAVIKAMLAKIMSKDILYNYASVLDGISDSFLTNMSSDDIYTLVKTALSGDLNWTVDTYAVDGTGDNLTMYSSKQVPNYVMIPDESTVTEAKRLIKSVLNEK